MYPSIPSNEVGVVIRDPQGQIYRELKEALYANPDQLIGTQRSRNVVLLKFRRKWGKPQK